MRIVGSIQGRPSVSKTSFSVRGYMSFESRRRVLSVLVSTTTDIDSRPLTSQSYQTSDRCPDQHHHQPRRAKDVTRWYTHRPFAQYRKSRSNIVEPVLLARHVRHGNTSEAHRQLPNTSHTLTRSVTHKGRGTHTNQRSPSNTSPAARR